MLPERRKYHNELTTLLSAPPIDESLNLADKIEADAHWAKYLCVLISGYLEQSFKEICLHYADGTSQDNLASYVKKTWPESANMKIDRILSIVNNFNESWGTAMGEWISEEGIKSDINGLVAWRNKISHGEQASTTSVTLKSVQKSYAAVNKLLDKLAQLFFVRS